MTHLQKKKLDFNLDLTYIKKSLLSFTERAKSLYMSIFDIFLKGPLTVKTYHVSDPMYFRTLIPNHPT